jgi:hypothetical protein
MFQLPQGFVYLRLQGRERKGKLRYELKKTLEY